MLTLFEAPDKVHGSIAITLPTETLNFDNLEELKRSTELRGRITNFWIFFSQESRRISIRADSGFFTVQTEVSARADNVAWCAGAVDTVYSFLQSHKVWYHWFVSAPLGWILFLFGTLPTIANLILPRETVYGKPVILTWLTITLALAILLFTRGKLLPSSTLCISEDEGFIRRHVGELNLILMIIGIVVTVILFFIGK